MTSFEILELAVMAGNMAVIIGASDASLKQQHVDGDTLLHVAAYYGRAAILSFLITRNVDTDALALGHTALAVVRQKLAEADTALDLDQYLSCEALLREVTADSSLPLLTY